MGKDVVPGDLCPKGQHPNFRPHVLVITDHGDEKEWEIEHHPECPLVCSWYPSKDGEPWFKEYDPVFGCDPTDADEGHRTCYVQWEIDANGIDSLAVVSHRERGPDGEWRDIAPYADPDYVPESPWEPEWLRLRPGRYVIEGWYQSGEGMGDYGGMGDPDGGLSLVSAA